MRLSVVNADLVSYPLVLAGVGIPRDVGKKWSLIRERYLSMSGKEARDTLMLSPANRPYAGDNILITFEEGDGIMVWRDVLRAPTPLTVRQCRAYILGSRT